MKSRLLVQARRANIPARTSWPGSNGPQPNMAAATAVTHADNSVRQPLGQSKPQSPTDARDHNHTGRHWLDDLG